MVGALKLLWPLALLAALPLLVTGCGNNAGPSADTKFRPVDDDDEPAKSATKDEIEKSIAERDTSQDRDAISVGDQRNSPKPATGKTAAGKPAAGKTGGKTAAPPPGGKGTKAASDDPALAGPTGVKVRLVRSLLRALGSEPVGNTQQEQIQNLMEQMHEITVTADEILAVEQAPDEAHDEALLAKFQVASMMLQFNLVKEAKEMLNEAAEGLAGASNPQYATLGRVQLFKIHAMDVLQLQPRDAKEVLTALDTLLEAGGDVDVITREVIPLIMQLERVGYPKEGVAALEKIGDHFADSEESNESLVGKQLQVSALVGKLRSGEGDAEKIGEDILTKSKEILAATESDVGGIGLLHQLARGQEGDAPELSGKLYDLIEETYAEHSDADAAKRAQELVASGRQRLGLPGKPLEISGVLVGGDPFDWSEYQGKVVLVHFWALSNQASLQDLSNMDRLYRQYHERGLEVIGVNLDKDVKQVEDLFAVQKLPWPTVTSAQAAQRGSNHPAAKACGVTVESVPYSVLIGADGKVVAAGLQSPLLDEAIVKLLPAAEDPPTDKDAKEEDPAKPDEKPIDDKKPADDDMPKDEKPKEKELPKEDEPAAEEATDEE